MDEHYLYLNSHLSNDRYPANEAVDFTVDLPLTYALEGRWMCALKEIQVSLEEDVVYACSDICEESYAENTMLPVLRMLYKQKGKKSSTFFSFEHPSYVYVKTTNMNSLRIFIRGQSTRETRR